MFRTLYGKLAAALTALVAGLLVTQIAVTMRATRSYEEEASQRLYRDVAATLLAEQVDPKSGLPVLRAEFEALMHVNPMVELYLVGGDGRLAAWSAPEGRVKLDRIDLAPVRDFLGGRVPLPIRGPDPRDPGNPKIFSAAEVKGPEGDGYLYVILQGEQYRSLVEVLRGSSIMRIAVGSLALVSVFALAVGLILFRSITRRVTALDVAMAHFRSAGGMEPGAGQDEIDRLGATFAHLAERVSHEVDDLNRLDRLRRELVAGVSHDLRTPLAALRGYLETLQIMGDELSPEDRIRHLDGAARQVEQLAGRVDALFELARLESGTVSPALETFPLVELVQDVVQALDIRAKREGVGLEAVLTERLPMAHADIALVERAIENLVENAIRHTPTGGRVELAVRHSGDELEIRVRDSGPGIPEEALPRVFESFFRGEGPGASPGGLGLGLAIVKRIAELHGGSVRAENAEGGGARVCLRIPAARPRQDVRGAGIL
ncbi:MAG: HAMP domain-containing sensor histidine kinase [Myxococcota bacterium]|nr:HAMP domain-containing sensor histidine kinase [Myxococcota bacterium]